MLLKPGISVASGVFGAADTLTEVTLFQTALGGSNVVAVSAASPTNFAGFSFSPSQSADLTEVDFYIRRSTTITGTFQLSLYSNTGSSPGTALRTITINTSTVATVSTLTTYTIPATAVTLGTTYWWVFSPLSLGGTGSVDIEYNSGVNATTASKFSNNSGSTWGSDSADVNVRMTVRGLV